MRPLPGLGSTALLLVGLLLLPSPGEAHPPAADASKACVVGHNEPGPGAVPLPLVDQLLSYLWLFPTAISPLCLPLFFDAGWASHAPACPLPPFEGPFIGNYCGPVVLPGGSTVCTWTPDINTLPTRLIVGFDTNADGLITDPAETPVLGPFDPGSWTVPNPFALPARVIAYPTNVGPHPPGATSAGDANFVLCT